VLLAVLAGAVFLSRSFGAKPLLKRTLLVGCVGLLMSVLLTLSQHFVATTIMQKASLGMQQGTATVLASAMSVATLGLVRKRMDRGVDGFLDRFMPATVIAEGKRKVLTVVFSDLGGYTGLSAQNEAEALHVAGHFQKAAADVARREGGRILKTIGDAVLWVFASPESAARAALRLPIEFAEHAKADRLPVLPVNSGIHTGSVVEAPDGDVYGAAVNLAARLQGAAKDGIVVASLETVQELGQGFRLDPLGKLTLKNIPVPVACFSVRANH
jgi:class 3 adenylate cyclase